jgi:uncharacterized protein (TIGR02680 family)
MAERWKLSRAGIINVYQYGDEVLTFAGGRLLLRGVNGSGKSTAMNMLLPFLLEADVRRIDAAGEQTGVLRSWMLTGREEQQPVGYLWLEFERGGEYLVCGCGIRANQSTPKATTWWFVTPRRPGIDLHLVAGRVPLSTDQLRAEIGQHAVFTHEQRAAYRLKIRADLFGGSDIDQHLRLLHIVRSPRVGDRIDSELTAYLDDALPQLSDAAIDDAAQPLENLEGHRRQVAALAATAETLDGLSEVYRAYAATEIRRRAADALHLVGESRACHRRERATAATVGEAEAECDHARATVAGLESDVERLTSELTALKEQPAYSEGKRLEDLREHVNGLAKLILEARDLVEDRRARLGIARVAVTNAAGVADGDQRLLVGELSEISAIATDLRLDGGSLDAPEVATSTVDDLSDLPVPSGPLTADALANAASALLGTVAARRGDVAEVRRLLGIADRAEEALERAERDLDAARSHALEATERMSRADEALAGTTRAFIDDLRTWASSTAALVEAADQGPAYDAIRDVDDPTAGVDVVDQRAELVTRLGEVVADLAESLRSQLVAIEASRTREAERSAELAAELDRLLALPEPEVPRAAWQTTTEAVAFGQLIDFADGLAEAERLGYEAALEASGLLGASFSDDGVTLSVGDLVVSGGPPVDSPLSAALRVIVPDELSGTVDADAVQRTLDSISTDPASSATTVVAADGSFRLGALQGRHQRFELAHVGSAARFAALQRRRDEVRAELARAEQAVRRSDLELDVITARVDRTTGHGRLLPTTRALDRALDAAERAAEEVERTGALVEERSNARDARERAVSDTGDAVRRAASTAGLPHSREDLEQADVSLADLAERARGVPHLIRSFSRSCDAWIEAGDRHGVARTEVEVAEDHLARRIAEHQPLAMQLATAQDALGVGYEEIVATIDRSAGDLAEANAALPGARSLVEHHVGVLADRRAALATAQAVAAGADRAASAELSRLRRILAVTGFREALARALVGDDGEPVVVGLDLPAVAESPDGVAELAGALLDQVPEPAAPATAESVRQSLRQRRDRLGANWDAGDRQPDESLPCEVEVTGPLGRMPLMTATAAVRRQLAELTSLLTAQQDQALRNLLQGLIAQEVSRKLHAARELVELMNKRLAAVSTAHGISAKLRWTRRDDLDEGLRSIVELMAKLPDLRSEEEDATLAAALSTRLDDARRADPEAPYRQLIGDVLDYRRWHEMAVLLERPGRKSERLSRRTALSEGEKKVVSYLPLFAAVAASCDALAEAEPSTPRFVLLDDAFAKVSEDNHPKLFGLLVDLDLDFIATSERLWGTYATVPELAITEVVRDARSGVILLEHARWDGTSRVER